MGGEIPEEEGRSEERSFSNNWPHPLSSRFLSVVPGEGVGGLSEDLAGVNSHPFPSLHQPYANIFTRINCGGGTATPIRQIRRKQTQRRHKCGTDAWY